MPIGNTYPSRPGGLQGNEIFVIFTTTDTYNCTLAEVQTFLNLSQYALATHNHNLVYEPIITKSTGYAKWTGSAWSFVNETYSLSSHVHTGTYEPANSNIQSHISSTSNPHSVTKTQVGLSNVPNTDTTDPANIGWTASYRTVTDTEKSTWNGKQAALGFTPEDVANKVTSISGSSTDTQYGSAKLLYDQLVLKANLSGAAFTGDVSSTGKITGRHLKNIQSVTTASTFTHNYDNYQEGKISALDSALTIAAPSGTPVDGEKFLLRLKDNGISRAITWNAIFSENGGVLVLNTVPNKWHTLGFIYNSTTSKLACVADTTVYTSNATPIIPTGCLAIIIKCKGGGASAAGVNSTIGVSAGASGGQYAEKLFDTTGLDGSTLTIVVGAGVTGTAGNGTNGNDTYVRIGALPLCTAKGGIASINNNPGLGSYVDGIGDIVHKGGNGDEGDLYYGGGGGSCGGELSDGENADHFIGGQYDGIGGGGALSQGDGMTSTYYGCGGGGALRTTTGSANGGGGAPGVATITYCFTGNNILYMFD
jgi:hypothetical protein